MNNNRLLNNTLGAEFNFYLLDPFRDTKSISGDIYVETRMDIRENLGREIIRIRTMMERQIEQQEDSG